MAICLDFDWQTNEFMLYCRTTQLREKTMLSYEQTLRLFEKWCKEEQGITSVDKVNENVIRRYIFDLQERGKYFTLLKARNRQQGNPRILSDLVPILIVMIIGSFSR